MKIFNVCSQYLTTMNKFNTSSKSYPNLAPLKCDTVSFGAIKSKNELDIFQRIFIERKKLDISTFESLDKLNDYISEDVLEITSKEYPARSIALTQERKKQLKEWFEYVTVENEVYTPSMQYFILNDITKELKANNSKLPPRLNKGVLSKTIAEIEENAKISNNTNISFINIYNQNMVESVSSVNNDINIGTQWVTIPSKTHDPENFEENVEKLKKLSHPNWCTSHLNAEPYLRDGDFHVYIENNKPKIGIRFYKDNIWEIQGELNNGKIPIEYYDITKYHIEQGNYNLSEKAANEMQDAKYIKQRADKIKSDLNDAIKKNDTVAIFNYFDIKTQKDANGNLIISHYKQPDKDFDFQFLGINENKLLKDVVKIEGTADFTRSKAVKLPKLETIGGNAKFDGTLFTEIPNLKRIEGSAGFELSKIQSLSKLEYIGKSAYFNNTNIKNLENLVTIKEHGNFENCIDINLSKLKTVEKSLSIKNSNITSLKSLEIIGKNAEFENAKISDLSSLREVKGDVNFKSTEIEELKNLKTIGGNANFDLSKIKNLCNLNSIGGDANFWNSEDIDLRNLESIKGVGNFYISKIKALPKLKTIGGVNFYNSKISNLQSLEAIYGGANFSHTDNLDLSNLKTITGGVNFNSSKISDLSNIVKIDGDADFSNCDINLENLKYITKQAKFNNAKVKLKNLEYIGANAEFKNAIIQDLNKLKIINWSADFSNAQITSLENLELIKGSANFTNTKIGTIPNLKRIEGDANFQNSSITNLDNLSYIKGDADFRNCKIDILPSLTQIDGYADFRSTHNININNLKSIGDCAYLLIV